ncbi:AEC family transporter [Cellulosilyticum ruminicola]|uniref:AEC family transporter n=1 Tax=Cellulosilyticum ruminicola TaxID=425254 RepID=UPI0006CF8A52|nr:AEC family transporter [Cellulosilyticum ruminicola]
MDFGNIYTQLGILFMILLIGYILGRIKFILPEHTAFLSKFVVRVTLPMLLVSSMIIPLTKEKLQSAIIILLLSIPSYALAYVIGLISSKFLAKDLTNRNIFVFASTFSNAGFMGFPVFQAIYGEEALFYAVIYNIPFNVLVYTLGIAVMNSHNSEKGKLNLKALINPGTVASVIGLALFIIGLPLPRFVIGSMKEVGSLCTPLSMITIGAMLSELPIKEMFNKVEIYIFAVIRLMVIPFLVCIVLYYGLKIDNPWLVIVPVITAGMPVATNTGMLAKEYKNNAILASQTILISTAMCIVTIPAMVYLLDKIM